MKLAKKYLREALALASLRRGFCSPNPCVGAILVKQQRVIAHGYHWADGHPHAEAYALRNLDASQVSGATLYVTLQPCCHTNKKTPPCTQLLIKKGIKRVIYGFRDPNPEVKNDSDQQLQQAGIRTTQQSLPEIDQFYTSYQFWWKYQRPFVTAKLAISLDGKSAGDGGRPIQLTGTAAQQFTHQQRLHTDIILTTAKTIQRDNPQLNARINNLITPKPVAILDSQLSLSGKETVFRSAKKVFLFYNDNLASTGLARWSNNPVVQPIAIPRDGTRLDLTALLGYLGKAGYHDLWVEAGGCCFQSLVEQRLLQRAFIYVAPKWEGSNAQSAFENIPALLAARLGPPRLLGNDTCFEFTWS